MKTKETKNPLTMIESDRLAKLEQMDANRQKANKAFLDRVKSEGKKRIQSPFIDSDTHELFMDKIIKFGGWPNFIAKVIKADKL